MLLSKTIFLMFIVLLCILISSLFVLLHKIVFKLESVELQTVLLYSYHIHNTGKR
jgi:hypothetical protein